MKIAFYTKWSLLLIAVGLIVSCGEMDKDGVQNEPEENNSEKIDSLITVGLTHYKEGEIVNSKRIFNQAFELLTNQTDTMVRISLLINSSELLKEEGKSDECLTNYFNAVNLATLTKDTFRLGLAYYNIATIQINQNKINEANTYTLKALDMYERIQDSARIADCNVLLSISYKRTDRIPLAKETLNQAISYYQSQQNKTNLAIGYNQYGNILLNEGKYMEAISFYRKAVDIQQLLNASYNLSMTLGNIGEAYYRMDVLDSAKYYFDNSLLLAEEFNSKKLIYDNVERLLDYYKKKNNLSEAVKASERLVALKTEIFEVESSDVLEKMEQQYKYELDLMQINNQLMLLEKDKQAHKKEQERTLLKLYFFVALSILIILVAYIIYKKQKRIREIDLKLHSKEKEILESKNKLTKAELANKENEKLRLQNELDFKRKELITFSFNLREREKKLSQLKNTFSEIKKGAVPDPDIIQELKNLLFNVQTNDKIEIYNRIEELNSSFHFNLKSKHPDLTEDDIHLASLMVLELSSKEIASILNIEPKSVDMKRYRLKKKLNIEGKLNLNSF